MAQIETWYNQDLQQPVRVHYLDGSLFSHNSNGNRIGVHVFNNGEPVTLTGTVSGYVVTADGSTVPCTGTRSGNSASILIPAAAYQPGAVFITLFITDGTTVTTLASVSTSVLTARTNNQIDPGSVVSDWTQTINAAMQSVETAAENLGGIIAVPYANITYPVPLGKYTYYEGNLYRCISPIATSESFTAAHWTQVRLADDVSDLKSAFNSLIHRENTLDFEQGNITSSGEELSANNRIRSKGYIFCPFGFMMTVPAGYKAFLRYYNENTAASISGSSGNWLTGDVNITSFDGEYIRVVLALTDDGNLSPSDISSPITLTANCETDKTLTKKNVPADAEITGNRIIQLKDDLGWVKISSFVLEENYSGDEYIVHSNAYPSSSGWVSDNSVVTFLFHNDKAIKTATTFSGNNVYNCTADGVTAGGWDQVTVPGASVARGYYRTSSSNSEYLAVALSRAAITNGLDNVIIFNTAQFYPVFVKPNAKLEFINGKIVHNYNKILPPFELGNVYASGVSLSSSTRCRATDWIYVKAGTIIDTSCTAVDVFIYGVSAKEFINIPSSTYISNGRRHQFIDDSFIILRYDVGTWNRPSSAPTLSSITQAEYFIRFITEDEDAENKWKGKTWRSYGTSISDIGVGETAGNNGSIGQWPLCVDALSGMTRYNGAIGGGSIMPASSTGGNVKTAILQCPFDVDLVTLELGPNDNYWDNLGEVGDTGDSTFLGNLYQIYDYLTKNTRALIVFVGIGARNLTGSTTNIIPANGEFRERYRTMIDKVKELSALFGIPVIDADANACNLNRRIAGVVMADYIHYTYLGGEIYGTYVWNQLKDMRPYFKFAQ